MSFFVFSSFGLPASMEIGFGRSRTTGLTSFSLFFRDIFGF